MNAMGTPLPRVDGHLKVTGGARYAAEFHPDGLAYAATHDSTIPAGRIVAIDTGAAAHAPGVLLVLTHLNADRLPYQTPAERPAVDPVAGEQLRVLQDAEVRFSGQPVALVVAATQAQALYAASLVRVTYALAPERRLRFDPELASRPPRPPRKRAAAPRPSGATPTQPSRPRRSGWRRPIFRRASSTTRWSRTRPSRNGRATS